MLERYENIAPDFLDEVLDEINYHDFRPELICITARKPIQNPCVLKEHRVMGSTKIVRAIQIEESFLQFLWCIAFSTCVMQQELIFNQSCEDRR